MISPLLAEIDAFAGPRRRPPLNCDLELALSAAIPLLNDLAASTRALPTRQLLRALNFDERRLGEWRLEHKLVQALVFRHYSPESLPVTCGFDDLVQGVEARGFRDLLRARFPRGYVIKTALGDGSSNDCDARTEAALKWMESGARTVPVSNSPTDEEFIVQERLAIRHEYRVHTVEDRVIEDLTVRRHAGAVGPGERSGPNAYVQSILERLPAGITAGSILAWDVALTVSGSISVVEVNIGGIHTVHNPGFHSSGYYHHKHYGSVYTARLLKFIERTHDCRIGLIPDAPDYPVENAYYADVADWKDRF
jgi:hypothetical protein